MAGLILLLLALLLALVVVLVVLLLMWLPHSLTAPSEGCRGTGARPLARCGWVQAHMPVVTKPQPWQPQGLLLLILLLLLHLPVALIGREGCL